MRFLNALYLDHDMDFKVSIIEKCKSLNNKWQIIPITLKQLDE